MLHGIALRYFVEVARTGSLAAASENLHVAVSDPTRKRLSWHDLRATGITWRAVRGDEPLKIQRAAWHSSFETTQEYIREAEAGKRSC